MLGTRTHQDHDVARLSPRHLAFRLLTLHRELHDFPVAEATMRPVRPVSIINSGRQATLATGGLIASSLRDRTVGLLGRSNLEAGEGLWIERSPSIHMFFMRFPIDAVFVDAQGRVTKVVENLRPWRIVLWARGARDCIELPVGTVAASGTQVGDRIELGPTPDSGPITLRQDERTG